MNEKCNLCDNITPMFDNCISYNDNDYNNKSKKDINCQSFLKINDKMLEKIEFNLIRLAEIGKKMGVSNLIKIAKKGLYSLNKVIFFFINYKIKKRKIN